MKLPKSVLTKSQTKTYPKSIGHDTNIIVNIRFDDNCNNGHNTFSITGKIMTNNKTDICGCIHDDIYTHFPELRKYLKWHGTHTDGPLHYIANTIYHAENKHFEYARISAVHPYAKDEYFQQDKEKLTQDLLERLPKLMEEFKRDMEELGFIY